MRPELAQACAPYRLVLPRTPLAGQLGARLGRGTGASLEFMEFRDYVPGDDLRHVDWRAYARTDQLKVRLFREEVAPVVDIVADLSPSMAVTAPKEQALRDLIEAFAHWALESGSRPRRLGAGGGSAGSGSAGGEFADASAVACDAPADPALWLRTPLRPRGVRVLLSDFLFPQDPVPLIRGLAAGAAQLHVVQLLDPWELAPSAEAPLLLVDAESGARQELRLSPRAVATYRERLERLRSGVEHATRAVGGRFAALAADAPARMFRDALLPQGLIEPA